MLQEPMMEKLTAMRLLGMVDALKTQEQDPAARELSFLERLGLLVDQQWTWRENQALARRLHAAKLKGACVRRHRLSRFSRAGQERDPRAGAEVGLGRPITKTSSCSDPPASARASWLARWRRRPAAMDTRRSTRAPPRCFAIWPSLAPTAVCAVCWRAQPHRRAGDRRLGHGSAGRNRTPRLLGDLRGPLSDALDDPDLATSRRTLARTDRRSHRRRRHPGPAGSQRSSHRDARRFDAQEARHAAVELA